MSEFYTLEKGLDITAAALEALRDGASAQIVCISRNDAGDAGKIVIKLLVSRFDELEGA